MRFRLRFSLRTLLLASLCAGGFMLVWSVHEPWTLMTWPICEQTTQSSIVTSIQFIADIHAVKVMSIGKGFDTPWRTTFVNLTDERKILSNDPAGSLSVSPARKYLIMDRRDKGRQINFYNTHDWKIVDSFRLQCNRANFILTPDDRLLYYVGKRPFASGDGCCEEFVEAVELATRKVLWKWRLRGDYDFAEIKLNQGNPAKIVVQTKIYDRRRNKDMEDSGIDSNATRAIPFSQNGLVCNTHEIDAETGTATLCQPGSDENDVSSQLLENRNAMAMAQNAMNLNELTAKYSDDGTWTLRLNPQQNKIVLSETKTGRELCVLSANGASLGAPFALSNDKRQIAACVDSQTLAVWTRTRQHLEWWGLYERWETWLALALFAAFVWSIGCDFKFGSAKP